MPAESVVCGFDVRANNVPLTSEYCPPGHYSPVNIVPPDTIHYRGPDMRFQGLTLVYLPRFPPTSAYNWQSRIMHEPGNSSATYKRPTNDPRRLGLVGSGLRDLGKNGQETLCLCAKNARCAHDSIAGL